MVEIDSGVSFPVVFFDGEREINIGGVQVHSSMDSKSFQWILCNKIGGISPHQISTYIFDRKNPGSRTPITGKFNFAAICGEKNCFFLVVLKRSRRERRQKKQGVSVVGVNENMQNKKDPPANVMLLRRNARPADAAVFSNQDFPNFAGFASPIAEYERRVRGLQVEKERYLMTMGLSALSLMEEKEGKTVCPECLRAKEMGRDVGFHWCVHDPVTFGFKSPAGPIARPVKGSI